MIANTCTCEEMQRKMQAFERKKKVNSHWKKIGFSGLSRQILCYLSKFTLHLSKPFVGLQKGSILTQDLTQSIVNKI